MLLQDYSASLVGAASSREYCSDTMQPPFIVAGSRSHKDK